jgi:transposase
MEERLRFVARLLDGEAMTEVCREFGISRKTGYKIFDRYKEHGLEALSDRSRRPVRYANQLPGQIETLIVQLKAEKPHWGARKIRELLVRRLDGDVRVPAKSTIHAVLDRHGLVKRGGGPRHRARGTPLSQGTLPNDLWCADFKGEFKLGNGRYCYPLGIFQADAYEGYGKLYEGGRVPGPILEAACWVHARRPFFVMADLAENARRKAQGKKPVVISPLALEAVRRIDQLFEIERAINGQSPERRKAVRQELSAQLVANLEAWMREQRAKLSRGNDVAKAMDYMLKRWIAFTRFLDDGRICLSNNAAERGVRGIALGRKSWLFCGSDRGGERAAVMYSLIVTAKMNDVDPQAWLADVLARIAEHPVQRLDELLPWNWHTSSAQASQAA